MELESNSGAMDLIFDINFNYKFSAIPEKKDKTDGQQKHPVKVLIFRCIKLL